MSRLLFMVGCVLMAAACSHKVQAPPSSHTRLATESECQDVYSHIVSIVVDGNVDPEHSLSNDARKGAEWELDQMYQQDGKKDKFIRSCSSSMTLEQANCAMQTSRLEQIQTCIKLFRR